MVDSKLKSILRSLMGKNYVKKFSLTGHLDDNILNIILTDSTQALRFVVLIEDEFKIEFDDDDVDVNFFRSFSNVKSVISKYL